LDICPTFSTFSFEAAEPLPDISTDEDASDNQVADGFDISIGTDLTAVLEDNDAVNFRELVKVLS
jgi:hypothetical protein